MSTAGPWPPTWREGVSGGLRWEEEWEGGVG